MHIWLIQKTIQEVQYQVIYSILNYHIILKIQKLIESAMAHPGKGIGKPEKLSLDLAGFWSRRINHQHRLVYTVKGNVLLIIQARFHYSDK